MPEPTTSSAAAAGVGWKLIGGAAGAVGIGAAAASVVVMCMSPPRSVREWAVALISTVLASVGGGAFVILKFGLLVPVLAANTDIELVLAVMGMLGIVFACGLPGWAVVRWAFNWMAKRAGRDLGEVARDAADDVRGVIGGRDHG
jgi:hypothetical protein